MMSKVPSVLFNNGLRCPIIGLGTWKSKPGEVTQAVKDAIDCGYRHFDCAYLYQNEKEVGDAITAKMSEGVVTRDQLFITSKLWNTHHRKELVKPKLKESLSLLGLDYLDLYLMHTPMSWKECDELYPLDSNGKVISGNIPFTETWKAMEECVTAGLTKSIGVSNFNPHQIKKVLDIATIKPVTNQVECHVYLNQSKMIEFCKSHNMLVTGYSPLGSPDYKSESNQDPPLKNPAVAAIAAKYNKNPGQILIKFGMQRGVIVIPKSVTKSRIQSNMDIMDFTISPQDMKQLESLDCNGRFYLFSISENHENYPFK